MKRILVCLPVLGGLILLGGCDQLADSLKDQAQGVKETVENTASDAVEKAQETAAQASEKVKELSGTGGSAELMLDQPLTTARCYATLMLPGAGRPAIFELKSYLTPADESAPSFLFHAESSATSLPELAGQQLKGQLFVQFAREGVVWHTPTDALAEVRILSTDGSKLEAEIVEAAVISSDGKTLPSVTGAFHALVP